MKPDDKEPLPPKARLLLTLTIVIYLVFSLRSAEHVGIAKLVFLAPLGIGILCAVLVVCFAVTEDLWNGHLLRRTEKNMRLKGHIGRVFDLGTALGGIFVFSMICLYAVKGSRNIGADFAAVSFSSLFNIPFAILLLGLYLGACFVLAIPIWLVIWIFHATRPEHRE